MLSTWERRGGLLDELTLDAFKALENRSDIHVLVVPEFVPQDSQLGCSVAGGYRWDPPTLIVTESMSRRRRQFTLLHELGHHIQKTDISLGTSVVEHREPEAFEDASCDAFAARILLPDAMVDAFVSSRGPTAQSAVELFEASNASRAAICVRLAGQLQSAGTVVVLNEAGVVTFASGRGGLYPPARGSVQTKNPLVRAALESYGSVRTVARENAQVWYSNGRSSERLYGQATWLGDHLIVIMVAYSAPWLAISPPQDGTAERSDHRFDQCENCKRSFTISSRCRKCHQPVCPSGHCTCTTARSKTCLGCFLEKHQTLFAAGSSVCLECDG
jgi:hypothetical protein